MVTIISDSRVPYYRQLYDILHQQIADGVWKPGDRLPSESELIDTYQVSRITVRQALDMLVKEGWIYRRRGRGTFVAAPTIEQGLTRIISFSEDMQRRGLHAATRVLDSRLISADEEIAFRLALQPGDELAVLTRLRLADGEPMSIEVSHLVHQLCPGILNEDYAESPLRQTLAERYGIRLVRAQQAIRAIGAGSEVAHELNIPLKSALFYIERITYSQDDRPVEFLKVYLRGDRYVFYNTLTS